GSHWRFHRRVADRLLEMGRQCPVVVLLEDCQWADAPTLELIGFLLRTLAVARAAGQPSRLCFVVTNRPAPGHDALTGLAKLAASYGVAVRIDLDPLDDRAATE